MECSEKQYQLLQNYSFNEPTTSVHNSYGSVPPVSVNPTFRIDPPCPSTDIDQCSSQVLTFNDAPLTDCQERPIVVTGTKAKRNLGYSVYAENFNKLLQRGSGTNRRKPNMRVVGEEEEVVYYGTESNEQCGIAFDERDEREIVKSLPPEQLEEPTEQPQVNVLITFIKAT